MSTSLETTVAMLARQVVMLERQVSALMLRRGAPFALARTTLAVNDTGPVQTVQAQLDARQHTVALQVRCHRLGADRHRPASGVPRRRPGEVPGDRQRSPDLSAGPR